MKRRRFNREYKQMVIELPNTKENKSPLVIELDLWLDLIYHYRQEPLTNNGAIFVGKGKSSSNF